MALTKSEKELLFQIAKKPTVLKTASATTLKKKEFIKAAVAVNPKAIKYAADEIFKDSAFLLNLVSENGMIAAYIPAKHITTYMFLKAIENTLEIDPYIPKRVYREMADGRGICQEKPYIVCSALSQSYHYYNPNLIKNKNVAIFISKHFMAGFSQRVAEKYNSDRDVALVAVSTSAHNYYLIDKFLQNDWEIIKCAYRNNPTMFIEKKEDNPVLKSPYPTNLLAVHRSEIVKDREFIKECMIDGLYILEPEYADDAEIALLAIKNAYEYVRGCWQKYRENNFAILSDRLKDDEEFVRLATLVDLEAISFASDRLKEDKDYILNLISAVSERPTNTEVGETGEFVFLEFLTDSMQDDEEIVAACIMENAAEFEHASDRLRYDSDYILTLMMSMDIDLYDYIPEEVKFSKEIAAYYKQKELKEKLGL